MPKEKTYPAPTFVACYTVHFGNSESQKTRKGSTRSSRCVENSDASLCLIWKIPFRDY